MINYETVISLANELIQTRKRGGKISRTQLEYIYNVVVLSLPCSPTRHLINVEKGCSSCLIDYCDSLEIMINELKLKEK